MDRVVPAGELTAGAPPRRIAIAGSDVLLVRLSDDRVAAFVAACPHQRTDLEGATFCDGRVRCPLHLYEYDLDTGENVVPARDLDAVGLRKAAPGYLRIHPVEERDGWIWVGPEPKTPPGSYDGPRAPSRANADVGLSAETVRVVPGATFELRLATTARTGFVWRVNTGGPLLAVVGERLEHGDHLVRLAARAPGRSTVRCTYARPWDRHPAEVRTYDVLIAPLDRVTPSASRRS